MSKVVLVNAKGEILGTMEKVAAHTNGGTLHRAFSVFVFNKRGELLLQKRSKNKMLWPEYWSNTCCSHPKQSETIIQAAKRRLNEELGFTCNLQEKETFRYTAKYKTVGTEKELCTILFGKYNRAIRPNPSEIAEIRWIALSRLKKDIAEHPQTYTPWFKIELKKMFGE